MATKRRTATRPTAEWDVLEAALTTATLRGARGARATRVLESFGEDEAEIEVLRRLAARSQLTRSRAVPLGNVVFLHGITGADLETVSGHDKDDVWIHFPRLILGAIERLKLAPDGAREADKRYRVVATRPNRRYYARGILALRARWNVEPFAYDWRKDIDLAADELAKFIRTRFPGKPVHLVAHSMGGLVARNLIRRDPQLWEDMQDHEGVAGGRLVMLGTPNYGSFAIVQAMTGEDEMMTLLEKCDLKHDMSELLEITNTFPGSYQLLPAPSKLSATLQALYQADTWSKRSAVSQTHLDRAYKFHNALDASATIDPSRMIYVAGCRRPTIESIRIAGRGDFEYMLSRDGDGRVPHSLGLLPDVPTYYVDEVHGDLARNEQVLTALDDLLQIGKTQLFGTTVLRGDGRGVPSMRDYRTPNERMLLDELGRIAALAEDGGDPAKFPSDDLRLGEDALIRSALGSGGSSRVRVPSVRQQPATRATRKPPLRIALKLCDICDVETPAVVVGHFRGVEPVKAIGLIDERLGGWISLALKRGMLSGNHGETFFIPTRGRGAIKADAVVIAGMGEFGRFSQHRLRILMANVAVGVSGLGLTSFSTLLVGAGEGNLDPQTALRAMLSGIGTGLSSIADESGRAPSVEEVVLVEKSPERFLFLADQLNAIADDGDLSSVRWTVKKVTEQERIRAARLLGSRRSRTPDGQPHHPEVRLTVESPNDGKGAFRFSAITQNAVIPVRDHEVSSTLLAGTSSALINAGTIAEQEKYGRSLYELLMPADFQSLIDGGAPVRLVVDRMTASLPWEMACFDAGWSGGGVRWLGLQLDLSRQFRTLLSQPPGTMPPLNGRLRVLIVADPASEPELQLPYARSEGRSVVETLRRLNRPGLRIDVESRIGSAECEIAEVLAQILTGGFDVVHFAGHGDYDPNDLSRTGWIFGRDKMLTAREIFRARRVPRLVFANACFSGVIHGGAAHKSDERSRGLATIAQAFFERGVPNYIGSGWPVNDAQAATFAKTFYETALGRDATEHPIRCAMRRAREALYQEQQGSTWGAYQHYGDPSDVLVKVEQPEATKAQQKKHGRGKARARRRRR